MKIFSVNEPVDKQIAALMTQIKHLRNGDTAHMISDAGASYDLNFGVMLVYLRQMGKNCEKNNELANRLWFRKIRETMIIATMVAIPDELDDEELNQWSDQIDTIELAEQVAVNLLGKRLGSDALLEKWLNSPSPFLAHCALMAIGWQYRFLGEEGFNKFKDSILIARELSVKQRFFHPVCHLMKMAGRFSPRHRELVLSTMGNWKTSDCEYTKQVAFAVAFELEGIPDDSEIMD